MEDLSSADRHDTGNTSEYERNPIYQDGSLHVTHHNHEHLAAYLTSHPQIPRRLEDLTISGSYGLPSWNLTTRRLQGPNLSLPVISRHFTEGMTGHLHIHNLDLSLLNDNAYEQFLQLVGSAPGRSGATSINFSCLVFRTITDVAQLLTRCTSAATVKAGELSVMDPMMRETFTSDVQWAQKKVFIGRGGQVHLFSIMLNEHVRLDNLEVLVISDSTQQTWLQLREVLRKAGGALHVLSIPLLSCDLSLLLPLDLTSNASLRVLTISHGLGVGNPIHISLYIRRCLETLLAPAHYWRRSSLRVFKLKILIESDQGVDVLDLGPIDILLCHSAPALKKMIVVLYVPDWSVDRMEEECTIIGRMMPLCSRKKNMLFQVRVIARNSY